MPQRPRSRPLGRLLAICLLAAACTGCGGGGPSASGHTTSGAPAHPAGTASATPTAPVTSLGPDVHAPLSTYFRTGPTLRGFGSLGLPSIDGDHVIIPAGTGDDQDAVVLLDAGTGKSRLLARTSYPHGFVGGAQVSGDWAAWIDQSAEQGGGVDAVRWKVVAADLSTGRQRVLATSARPTRYVPSVFAQDGYVFWTTAEADGSARQWVWKAGSGGPVSLLRHQELTPELESADGGRLYFLGPSGKPGSTGHTVGGDCWSVPLAGGTPKPLTATALALDCQAHAGWLVWSLHYDPAHPPSGQKFDDPYEIWARPLGGGATVLLHRGYVGGGSPTVGDGFAVWDGNGFLMYSSLDGEPAVDLDGTTGAYGFAASGDRLAYVTFATSGTRSATLHVVTRR